MGGRSEKASIEGAILGKLEVASRDDTVTLDRYTNTPGLEPAERCEPLQITEVDIDVSDLAVPPDESDDPEYLRFMEMLKQTEQVQAEKERQVNGVVDYVIAIIGVGAQADALVPLLTKSLTQHKVDGVRYILQPFMISDLDVIHSRDFSLALNISNPDLGIIALQNKLDIPLPNEYSTLAKSCYRAAGRTNFNIVYLTSKGKFTDFEEYVRCCNDQPWCPAGQYTIRELDDLGSLVRNLAAGKIK